jgi:hypothetical protein
MHESRSARRRRFVWTLAAKAAFTLVFTLPRDPADLRGAVDYQSLSTPPAVRSGMPVMLSGQLVGYVVATPRRGDTTVIRVRFDRRARPLPGGRVAALRRIGLGEDDVALEFRPTPRRGWECFARRDWLRVLPAPPRPDLQPELRRPDPALPERHYLRLIPTVPAAPRPGPSAST